MTTQTKAVAVIDPNTYAVMEFDAAELAEIVADNLGGENITAADLDKITLPLGGNTLWTIPTLEGEAESPSLEGVIIHTRTARGYWAQPFDGSNTPPDCRSDDGQWGEGEPGGQCVLCPLSKFGAQGERPACRVRTEVFLLRPQSLMPTVVRVPPTSMKAIRGYTRKLTGAGIRQTTVITALTLRKVKSEGSSLAYAVIVPQMAGRLSKEQSAKVQAYAAAIRPLLTTPIQINEIGSLPGDELLMTEASRLAGAD